MSCTSPSTVPMTMVPSELDSPAARCGLRTLRQLCMVRALSSTSGMKQSPAFMRRPTSSMPGSRPVSRISRAPAPSARAAFGQRQGDVGVAVDDRVLHGFVCGHWLPFTLRRAQ